MCSDSKAAVNGAHAISPCTVEDSGIKRWMLSGVTRHTEGIVWMEAVYVCVCARACARACMRGGVRLLFPKQLAVCTSGGET